MLAVGVAGAGLREEAVSVRGNELIACGVAADGGGEWNALVAAVGVTGLALGEEAGSVGCVRLLRPTVRVGEAVGVLVLGAFFRGVPPVIMCVYESFCASFF